MTYKIIRKYLWWTYRPLKEFLRERNFVAYGNARMSEFKALQKSEKQRIYYLGITEHSNLGDMGQHYCIKKWIKENYPIAEMVMMEATVITNKHFADEFFSHLKSIFNFEQDRIVFQSGYCTQDLGGLHPLMHYMVCERMPEAKILMMPQTIFFKHEKNKQYCAKNHNQAKRMLFLARDYDSYDMAKGMFHNLKVIAFPDIVTTLIGTLSYSHKRDGVCVCTRNDGEKFYSDKEIAKLSLRLKNDGLTVANKDTQSNKSFQEIKANLQHHIEQEIESYSHYEVTITDRYHGTIFSLCAGTPVIIIKTTDHKVTTGADWFKGVYDSYVYVAKDLEEAYRLSKEVIARKLPHDLKPHMKQKYYDTLKSVFEEN